MALSAVAVTERKLPKAVVGDFTFAEFVSSRRGWPLLLRNIRQSLVHHEDKLSGNDSINYPCQPQQSTSAPLERFADEPASVNISELPAKPVVEAASQRTLVVRTMEHNFENTSRRSVRRLQEAAYHNDDAELLLDLVSIRKKLNFTTNRVAEDEQPRKKTKSGHVKCLCSLTIWDNRNLKDEKDAEAEPLVKKHVNGTAVTFETEDRVPNVNIQLDEPFKVRAKDLKVCLRENSGETTLGIIEDYFLEVKLIPSRSDVDWPPIPVLGKSDGDSQRGLATISAEILKGALVARYQKLPKAPQANVPLSVFFNFDGSLHKTKYGLELNARWAARKATHCEPSPEVAARLPGSSWTVDSAGTSFGRKKTVLTSRTRTSPPPSPAPNMVPSPPVTIAPKKVKVSYLVDPDSAKTADLDLELRTVEMDDFGCPICVSFTAKDVLELRFHFILMHSKYNFVLANDKDSKTFQKLDFRIVPIGSGKPGQWRADEKVFEYFAKRAPFNVSTYLEGDKSWTGEIKGRLRAQPMTASARQLVEDPATVLRTQNGGHLVPQDVRDFRRPERKKHRIVHLDRKHDDKRTPYSSISHRPRSISEDAVSETDDEIDDEWFIERHLENLDIISKKESWSELRAELLRRWNRHRLEEKLEHPRFMSDSLVRFVRKERDLLRRPDPGMQAAISALLLDLVRSRYITLQFCTDIRAMIYDGTEGSKDNEDVSMIDAPRPEKSRPPSILNPRVLEQQVAGGTAGSAAIPVNLWKKQVLSLPKSCCGVCTKTIFRPHREAVHCSNHDCLVAGTAFHLKCVKQKQRERGWACHGCTVLGKTYKGKAKAVD